jgi:hypothetical protein
MIEWCGLRNCDSLPGNVLAFTQDDGLPFPLSASGIAGNLLWQSAENHTRII